MKKDATANSHQTATPRTGRGTLATAGTIVRATTAVVVFGLPLVAGTAALVGYGLYRGIRRLLLPGVRS